MEWLGYFFAIIMGISLGLIGGGGSILTVPILIYCFKQDALSATTGSLLVVGTSALLGALLNFRKGFVDLKTAALFAVPSFAGVAFIRRIILPQIPEIVSLGNHIHISKAHIVLGSFSILMIAASRAMIKSGNGVIKPAEQTSKAIGTWEIAIKGFLVGCTTAFVGAGGGFLIIPVLVILMKMPMRVAVGTSLAIIAANSFLGLGLSLTSQELNWNLLGIISAIGMLGLIIGQRFSSQIPEKKLKTAFGYFVLVLGLLILADQISKL